MKIIEVSPLAIPDVHVVRFARFADERGYFTETFRRSVVESHEGAAFLRGLDFVQMNESVSRPDVVRGLHFQWNPYMGKLVRTISGRMVDLVLDIRLGSPTFGKLLAHDMPAHASSDSTEWIWVPPGFAHGFLVLSEEAEVIYKTSDYYAPQEERTLLWSDPVLGIRWPLQGEPILAERDRHGAPLERAELP